LDDLFNIAAQPPAREPLMLATVGSVSAAGTTLILDGQTSATTKRYKRVVTGQTLAAGDRVLVARISGTYVIFGKISN